MSTQDPTETLFNGVTIRFPTKTILNGVTIRTEQFSPVVASTSTRDELVIVSAVMNIQCCDTQRGWERDDHMWPYDTSGIGQWIIAGGSVCVGCGSFVMPPHEMLTDPTQEEIDKAIAEVGNEAQDLMILEKHKVISGLTDDLMTVVDAAGDLMDVVNASGFIELDAFAARELAQKYATGPDTEPGVSWEDGRGWVVWGIDKYGRVHYGVYRVHGDGTIAWTTTKGDENG